MKPKAFLFDLAILVSANMISHSTKAQLVMDSAQTAQYTCDWQGKRDNNGRPFVASEWLGRAANCGFEDLWTALRNYGYPNQYEGFFQSLHVDSVMVGRALTAEFVPQRKDVDSIVYREARSKNWGGSSNSWPILQLQKGDVYVADAGGKLKEGTLIGDNLGSSIYARSGNGVVFNGSARDRDGLKEIKGFNAWVKGWDPSYLKDMTLLHINHPARIGNATVLPGDIVIGNFEGVIFIPYTIADKVIVLAELIGYRGLFGKEMLSQKVYQPGQIDNQWSEAILDHFVRWLKQNYPNYKITKQEVTEAFKQRSW